MDAETAHRIAQVGVAYRDSKGFAPCTWETFPHRLCSLIVEIDELREAIDRHHTGWPTRYELADVALYASTMLRDLAGESWTLRQSYHGGARRGECAALCVLPLHRHALDAHRAWQRGRQNDALIALELVLVALVDLRDRVLCVPGTLDSDVAAKVAVMQGRESRHGGKHPWT